MNIPFLHIDDYNYPLPEDRIAKYPLEKRDDSKLLIYRDGQISEDRFRNIASLLPPDHIMVFNETRVIRARLFFRKSTGAIIEIFCLEPANEGKYFESMQSHSPVTWKCLTGNSKRWKSGKLASNIVFNNQKIELSAERLKTEDNTSIVKFNWNPAEFSFHDILNIYGTVPLPPYLKREADKDDPFRYQTIYAKTEGSVAAPTAGLHFTENTFNEIRKRNIQIETVTLHVGAGTFIPVSTANISAHIMHAEYFTIEQAFLEKLLSGSSKEIIAVGTTTVRTLESMYWLGVKLIRGDLDPTNFEVGQWDGFSDKPGQNISREEALATLSEYLGKNHLGTIQAKTSLMIAPGYRYRLPGIMVTNFHQPKSTLLLLVAAFIGDTWKEAYTYALEHGFRFLSYGDACLFYIR